MKKNNIALDLISFGSSSSALLPPLLGPSSSTTEPTPVETNETKLTALLEAVNSSDNSHLLTVETGSHLLSEKVASSAILRDGDAEDDSGAGGAGEDGFGVDPNLDPELAMVSTRFGCFTR